MEKTYLQYLTFITSSVPIKSWHIYNMPHQPYISSFPNKNKSFSLLPTSSSSPTLFIPLHHPPAPPTAAAVSSTVVVSPPPVVGGAGGGGGGGGAGGGRRRWRWVVEGYEKGWGRGWSGEERGWFLFIWEWWDVGLMWLVVYVSTFHWYTGGNEGQVLGVSFSLIKLGITSHFSVSLDNYI